MNTTKKMEELLAKYFTGEITEQEKSTLFKAMDANPSLREEFYALHHTIAITSCMKTNKDDQIGKQAYSKFTKALFKKRTNHWLLAGCKYCALISLIVISTYLLTHKQSIEELEQNQTEITAPSGQRVKVNLPDGTTAWLSPCSTLRYSASFNSKNRDVELEGATFFEVAPNKNKPFHINIGNYRITVLGTSFNVMAYPNSKRFEIDLVKGSVQINNIHDSTDQLTLYPHEQAILQKNRLLKQTSEFNNEEYLKSGIVNFKSRPFGEILDNVALWQGIKLTVEETVDTHRLVTGKFRQSDSLESILRALQSVSDFRYKITDEKHVIIYR